MQFRSKIKKSLKIQPRNTIRLLYFLYFHVEFVRCFCILYFPVFGVLSCFVICDLKIVFLCRCTVLPNHQDTLPSIHPSTHLVNGFGLAVPRSNTALALLEKEATLSAMNILKGCAWKTLIYALGLCKVQRCQFT